MTARISAVPSAGHRRYDPEAIARYYWRHPWRVIWRFVNISVSFLTFWLLLQWDKWLGQQESQRPLRAMQLRKLLIRLGPTFIKVGQALSTRPDLICPDYLEELTLLQDKLPPFANEIAIAIIERDLRLNLGDIFAEFSPQPGGRRQSRPSLSSQTPQW